MSELAQWLDRHGFDKLTNIMVENDVDLDENGDGIKDARTSDICEAARLSGVTIYTIGFETDADGDRALKDCASSAAHFFNAQGTQISDVFAAIAADIGRLKLTH